ncbi:MAG TPA: hypothetical protein VH206_01265 [Xanthobacteraceae bacterium]|jgi:hypothetical protein|nr:hypothetical protein [Xanthobacteraceae bacterium]
MKHYDDDAASTITPWLLTRYPIEFSKSWVEIFRQAIDSNDEDIREDAGGERPDDQMWWQNHRTEIGFFFDVIQRLRLGHFDWRQERGTLTFCAWKDLRRIIKETLPPNINDL